MRKSIFIAGGIAVLILMGAFAVTSKGTSTKQGGQEENNVHYVKDVQIIEIDAKGGYLPRTSIAKAGVPTIVRFNTTATFDCSSSVRIPSLDVSKILPQTGSTDIDIGIQKAGPLEGSCGMGMYPFEIVFE